MNVKLPPVSAQRQGMALLVVMVLLVVMCALMFCAAQSVFSVKRELGLIEKQQLRRAGKTPVSGVR